MSTVDESQVELLEDLKNEVIEGKIVKDRYVISRWINRSNSIWLEITLCESCTIILGSNYNLDWIDEFVGRSVLGIR